MSVGVFRVNDVDWWLGETAEQVLHDYCVRTGLAPRDALDEGDALPRLLTDAELDALPFVDIDGTRRTFREQLQREIALGGPVPRSFASTEF